MYFLSAGKKQSDYISSCIADAGVGENAIMKFMKMFPHWQINQFYLYQGFNESIHSETYAIAVETFIEDEQELMSAFDAIERDPAGEIFLGEVYIIL